MIFISVEEVIDYHEDMIHTFGGLPGIRDIGLLISAMEMPKAIFFDEDLHPTVFDKAAAYLFHLISNHPFMDANKRTATITMLTFLETNGVKLAFNAIEMENLVVDVAQGKISKKSIAIFLANCATD